MRVPFKQIGLTTAAAGVAAAAIVGAWGAWSTGDAADQSTRSGVLDLDLGAASFSTAFGTEANPLAPGDTGCRVISLVNDGNVDMINLKLHVATTLTEGNYTDSVNEAGATGDVDETITSDENDFRDNVEITALYQDDTTQADSAPISIPACGDVGYDGNTAVATTTLSDIDTSGEADLVSLGDGAAGDFDSDTTTIADRDVKYLELSYEFLSTAPDTAGNVYGNLEWIFTADQRAAVTNQ